MKKYFIHLLLILLAGLLNLFVGIVLIVLSPILAFFTENDGLTIKYKDLWSFNYEF